MHFSKFHYCFRSKLKQQSEEQKSLESCKEDEEKKFLEDLQQNGMHLPKIESVTTADGHQRVWICPGLVIQN